MRRITDSLVWVLLPGLLLPGAVMAGPADVLDATARCDERRVCHFEVTVRHADTGWDHYADRWDVLSVDGDVLATRVLHHPHEHEQPFTRGLGGVELPDGAAEVRIRARDSVHGYTGAEIRVRVP